MKRPRRKPRISAAFVPVRADDTHTVEADGEAVVLDEGADRLHLLNPTAALLWACFDGVSSLDEIAADIAEELGASPDVVLSDAVAVTRDLGEKGLLANVDAPRRKDADRGTVLPAATSDPRFVAEPPNQ